MREVRQNGPGRDEQGVAQHRDYLYRYALLHLRDESRAEDVVQETLLAAVEGKERFSGRSSLRTWLTGILKHKIVDVFRRQAREAPLDADQEADADEEFADLRPGGPRRRCSKPRSSCRTWR